MDMPGRTLLSRRGFCLCCVGSATFAASASRLPWGFLDLSLVRDWGAFRAGLYAFVSPIVAVVLGVVVADEAFGWPEAVGMAVMFAATAIALTEGRGKPEYSS